VSTIETTGTIGPEQHPDDDLAQQPLEVRRDGPLSLLVGGSAGVVAVAFLLRAVGAGTPLDWALVALTGVIAAVHLAAVVDARAPLVVLDGHGARVRRGAVWQGVAWSEVDRVEHRPRLSMLRDGSLTIVTHDGRRLGVRLSLSTRLVGADWHEVDEALGDLSGGAVPIVGRPEPAEVEPPVEAVEAVVDEAVEADQPDPVEPAAVEPARASRPALRSEVVVERAPRQDDAVPAEDVDLPAAVETTVVIGLPAATVPDPVVGPQLAAARQRIGISVEALAERTRIRPHVIESIEVDDFEPCGGDFYARGHLRTLARVLGVEAAGLLAQYDERYAHAPIDARRVFEAELAAAPSGSGDSRGLNWSVLVAAVMAVVLVWSVARLVMDGPVPLADQPVLNGSPGGRANLSSATTEVPVVLTAATGGAQVVVRDARQQVVFDAQLAFMQTAELSVAPPVRISTTDGGLQVTLDGVDEGSMGATGEGVERTYVP
jgi:cytoskeleton protein RodZ